MTVFPFPELDGEKEAEYEIFPINLTRMLLHTQGQTLPYLKFALSFRSAKIPPVVREQVIARVGAVAECEYQLVQHKSEAQRRCEMTVFPFPELAIPLVPTARFRVQ